MTAVARNFMLQPLRVLVLAADSERRLRLVRLMPELGHLAVPVAQASIALTDGLEPPDGLPAGRLGFGGDDTAAILPPDASSDQIDAALRAVAAGLRVRPATDHRRSFHELERQVPILLTPRETDVLNALATGMANKEIARQLGISLHTVKFHLESLMRKLNASSRTEAIARALRLGLLDVLRV